MEEEMRHVDKRRWICTSIIGNCPLSSVMASNMHQEVPVDKTCPLCHADITIFGEMPELTVQSIMEIVPEWQCRGCNKTGSWSEANEASRQCPDCGGEIITPLVKKDGPFGSGLLKKH